VIIAPYTPSTPAEVIIPPGPHETVYVPFRSGIYKMPFDLSSSTNWAPGANSSSPWICIDGDGTAYVTAMGYTGIAKMAKIPQAGVISDISDAAMTSPRGVAIDSAGNLYIADSTKVLKRSTAGVVTDLGFTGLSNPQGIAVDASGNVYVADLSARKVYKKTPAGVQTTITAAGLDYPKGLAFGPDGRLYVSCAYNPVASSKIIAVNLTTSTAVDLGFPTFAQVPGGVAVGSDGTVFTIEYAANSIVKAVNPALGLSWSGTFGNGGGNNSRIAGIAVGPPIS